MCLQEFLKKQTLKGGANPQLQRGGVKKGPGQVGSKTLEEADRGGKVLRLKGIHVVVENIHAVY